MLASADRKGRPTGFEPVPRGSRPRMLPLHHGHHGRNGDDRARTGDPSPDKRVLCRLSYAPLNENRTLRSASLLEAREQPHEKEGRSPGTVGSNFRIRAERGSKQERRGLDDMLFHRPNPGVMAGVGFEPTVSSS